MVSGAILRFLDDLDVKVRAYTPKENQELNEATFAEFRRDIEALEERIRGGQFFIPAQDSVALLASFGPSYVLVEYGCDDYLSWCGNQIYEARVKDGAQARALIEKIIQGAGPMAEVKQAMGVPTSLETIRVLAQQQAETGRRTINLQFGAGHIMMLWREMFNVYVAEAPQEPAHEQREQQRRCGMKDF